jgi:pilus assembly protein FimV
MGDEDGARQILQEIVAEGSDELKAEAQALIARID